MKKFNKKKQVVFSNSTNSTNSTSFSNPSKSDNNGFSEVEFEVLKFGRSKGYESLNSICSQCKLCGWGIIDVCCNFADDLDVVDKLGEDSGDWMSYCLNKGCQNHLGVHYSGGGSCNTNMLNVKL